MVPNDLLVTVRTGLPKFGWFNRSNTSVRNCRLSFSPNFVFLVTEKSVFRKSGPVMESRPRLPGWQLPKTTGYVPEAVGTLLKVQGTAKAAFGVDAQAGKAGFGDAGSGPLKFSHTAALLKYCVGLPVPVTVWSEFGLTVKEMPGPGPTARVGVSGLPQRVARLDRDARQVTGDDR